MEISFYDMAVRIVGEVPTSLNWIYDFTTLCLICCAFALIIIPVSLIFKRVVK